MPDRTEPDATLLIRFEAMLRGPVQPFDKTTPEGGLQKEPF